MKKWIAFILSFYILFSAIAPCSLFDKCEEEQYTESAGKKERKNDCNDCPPFSFCCSAHSVTLNTIHVLIEPIEFNNFPSYNGYYLSSTSEYYSSLFQPPKVG
ncbi:MAG: hypothetical protein QM764_04530 [Chitinophagaceae bacterium]